MVTNKIKEKENDEHFLVSSKDVSHQATNDEVKGAGALH